MDSASACLVPHSEPSASSTWWRAVLSTVAAVERFVKERTQPAAGSIPALLGMFERELRFYRESHRRSGSASPRATTLRRPTAATAWFLRTSRHGAMARIRCPSQPSSHISTVDGSVEPKSAGRGWTGPFLPQRTRSAASTTRCGPCSAKGPKSRRSGGKWARPTSARWRSSNEASRCRHRRRHAQAQPHRRRRQRQRCGARPHHRAGGPEGTPPAHRFH